MGENNPFFGKTLMEKHVEKIRKTLLKTLEDPEIRASRTGENNPAWKGGYASNNIPIYDTYVSRLEPYEECRRKEEDPNILEVKCT